MIGRAEEQRELNRLYNSKESEFLALYGRRRVGKTYLVRETFDGQLTFCHTGKSEGGLHDQLLHFRKSLEEFSGGRVSIPRCWDEAFDGLKRIIASSREKRKVVFIDELPWMDTPRSKCLSSLESFWNEWASARKDVFLIVCGSAASWMVKNLFRNRGGLHNRVTARMCLKPFTLGECEKLAADMSLSMSRSDIAECYMILGGIPFYWRQLRQGRSLPQNIDAMFFRENAPLKGEFGELYKSLFGNAVAYEKVVAALARKKAGMGRAEIVSEIGQGFAGGLTGILETLESSGFVRRYRAMGKRKRDGIYQLMDNFTLFHFKFLRDATSDESFWQSTALSSARAVWKGLSFERVCLQHVRQIRAALGISGVHVEAYAWSHAPDETYPVGAQIDLLLDRSDGVVNVCEMKFSPEKFVIDAKMEEALMRKLAVFTAVSQTRKAVHLTMVTPFGLLANAHSGRVQSEVTLDDLFRD